MRFAEQRAAAIGRQLFEIIRVGRFAFRADSPYPTETAILSIANSQESRLNGVTNSTTDLPPPGQSPKKPHKMTGINIPEDLYVLLNRVAWSRSRQRGGRSSVSALLVDLVERHRAELEEELAAGSH